jgi:hypothetical protein
VHGGGVEGVIAIADAEEAGGLLERLGADAGDLKNLLARAEAALLIAEGDDVEGGALADAGDVAQKRPRGCVEVDADAVDAAFDDSLE